MIDVSREWVTLDMGIPERAPQSSRRNEQLYCSFCGNGQRQVEKLIAGPGVYICNECIDLRREIIEEEPSAPQLR